MKNILSLFAKMEKFSLITIHIGLICVALIGVLLFAKLYTCTCPVQFILFKESLPYLALSVPSVFAGGFALDSFLKENKPL